MSNTGGARAWRFLKRNPHYIGAWRKAPGAAPDETAPFPIRARTAADRKAAAWGLMAWEDPVATDGTASPFWTVAPTMRGFPVPGAPPLTELLEGPGVRLSGLRLETGTAIVRIAQGDAAVHLRIEDGAAFDPAGGIVYGFENELALGLRLRRAADLWPIAAAAEKKTEAQDVPGSRTMSFSWSSTPSSPAGACG